MKSLVFLLLLDYSGSMDQVWQNKSKIQTLKEEATALLSTQNEKTQSMALVFGSDVSKGCRDLRSFVMPSTKLTRQLQSLKPDNQGKTPLAFGLTVMVDRALTNNIKSAVVITDGADSCGQDPCKALEVGDKALAKQNKKLKVHIIGMDLKREGQKFQCFKELKLNNIEISMSEASNVFELQQKIKEGQLAGLNKGDEIKDGDTHRNIGLTKNKIEVDPATQQGDVKNVNADSVVDIKTEGFLEIVGAPTQAEFEAISKQQQKKWSGPYVLTLPAASYKVAFLDNNGVALNIELGAGTHVRIPWVRLLKKSQAAVYIHKSRIGLTWTPTIATGAIHQNNEKLTIAASLEGGTKSAHIPFGAWTVEPSSPPWLEKKLKARDINLTLDKETVIDLEDLYKEELRWVKNPKPQIFHVMVLKNKEGAEERHLISPGAVILPIPVGWQESWIEH